MLSFAARDMNFVRNLVEICAYGCLFPSQIFSNESIIIICLLSGATGANSNEGT